MNLRPDLSANTPTTVDNANVTVVGGAGHVGVPLVLALAEAGARVNVNDINEDTLEILKSGRLPYIEYDAADLLTKAVTEKRLVFTHAPEQISRGAAGSAAETRIGGRPGKQAHAHRRAGSDQ